MFRENLKTNKQKIHLYSKKVLKSFISSRYLKLKINILFWECFLQNALSHMHIPVCTHPPLSLMFQHCSWFVLLVPRVTFTVVTLIKVYQMPLVTWTLRKQNAFLGFTFWGKKIHLPKPFPNTRLSKLSKAYLGNKSKRESEKSCIE